ncbi:hypothetical protein M0R04_08425 [Candidatus Dojkabacteria bacterium]|jgi:hypothetical protein|nr:hypothetical protein [Candidatus Dojkabacteria bacterium]
MTKEIYLIEKFFRITCPDCKATHESPNFALARAWLKTHRDNTPECRKKHLLHKGKDKIENIERLPNGHIVYRVPVTCPICKQTRLVGISTRYMQQKRYKQHLTLDGICRPCRMKHIKPAKKGTNVLLLPVEQSAIKRTTP